jgi:hypothetical protein
MHTQSEEGDWIYPREINCRFHNFCDQCPELTNPDLPMPFLLVLLIVKCGVVARYDANRRSIKAFESTSGGQRIHEVQMAMEEMLIDENLVNIKSQQHQVDHLIRLIQRKNPTALPAILSPAPIAAYFDHFLEEEDNLGEVSTEALSLLVYCKRCLFRIPGSFKVLKRHFEKHS